MSMRGAWTRIGLTVAGLLVLALSCGLLLAGCGLALDGMGDSSTTISITPEPETTLPPSTSTTVEATTTSAAPETTSTSAAPETTSTTSAPAETTSSTLTRTAGTDSSDGGDTIVHITETGKKYHRAGCRHLSKSDIEVTLAQAEADGLGPCTVCDPPQ